MSRLQLALLEFTKVDSNQDKREIREDVLPVIIPRANHPISRSRIDEEALKVLYRLHHHGFLSYLVGGSVRDLFLGRIPKDFDVATNAHPHEINTLFRNSRIIGRRFRLLQVYFKGGKVIEVSTFRSRSEFEETQAEDGTMIRTDSFGTPGEDAFRRDLTINGLFYNIADFSIIDYVGGMEDLHQGIIRTIGDPNERFQQDPVRMIRVIRHATRTGFRIDEPTYQALLRHREELRKCSPSRVRDEFLRELKEGVTEPSLKLMLETGLLFSIFPEFQRVFGDRNPKKGRDREFFLSLFSLVDQLVRIGKPVSETILLALLVTPLLRAINPEHPYLGEKERYTYSAQMVRLVLHQLLSPFSFPRGTKEMAALVLTVQSSIERSIRHGVVHKRLRMKKYFQEAVLFFGIVAQAKGERVPHLLRRAVSPDLLPWWPKEIRKRRRG
ncbi:MAG TPA: polynucleotide adenylyltransferase PcnB [Thermodesulfobacteriota bacterium]|nr:polynucleotide adenylyltransferase PcnB [Thermodesulfobacteriota bacterium]